MWFRSLLLFLAQVGRATLIHLFIGIVGLGFFFAIRYLRNNPRERLPYFYFLTVLIRFFGMLFLFSSVGVFLGTQLALLFQLNTPYAEVCASLCAGAFCVIGFKFWHFVRTL